MKSGVSSGGDTTVSEEPGCVRYPPKMTNRITCPAQCDDGYPLDKKIGENHLVFFPIFIMIYFFKL